MLQPVRHCSLQSISNLNSHGLFCQRRQQAPEPFGTRSSTRAVTAVLVTLAYRRCHRRLSRKSGVACSGANSAACVVVSGIPGSGKSTLCRLLCGAFEDSAWFNQDNYVSSRNAKMAFLQSLKNGLQIALRQRSALVCVDKVNLQKAHRQDILKQAQDAGWMENGGILLLCELTTNDIMEHCMSRIESRGAAHKSLKPSKELKAILEQHSDNYQPPDKEELQVFQQVQIDARQEAVEKATQVVGHLRDLGWSPRLRPLEIAAVESDEWVKFPCVDEQRPTYYWNRRTGESVWHKPDNVEPAFHGFPFRDQAYFRCVRTAETMWELPPLTKVTSPALPTKLDAEEQLRFLLEAEWARLQFQEESWRHAAGTAQNAETNE